MNKYFLILREVSPRDLAEGTITDDNKKDFILGISHALYDYLMEKSERAIKAQSDQDQKVIFDDELLSTSAKN